MFKLLSWLLSPFKCGNVHARDLLRLIPLVWLCYELLAPDDRYKVFGWLLGVVALMAIVSHIMRRIFWPYVDLAKFARAALDDKNMAAAVVFASVAWFVTVSFTQLLSFFLK